MACVELRTIPNIATEAGSCIYHGIKRLWSSEVELWKQGLSTATYSLYQIPNSNHNLQEFWVVDKEDDLATLKKYLQDYNRADDFQLAVKIS